MLYLLLTITTGKRRRQKQLADTLLASSKFVFSFMRPIPNSFSNNIYEASALNGSFLSNFAIFSTNSRI